MTGMFRHELPCVELLRELLAYDADSGLLYWKSRPVSMFGGDPDRAAGQCKIWNKRFAGKQAFVYIKHGYRQGRINRRRYNANRVIWKIVTGQEPGEAVDHIDGDTLNDRFANLQAITQKENVRKANRAPVRANAKGVSWDKNRWVVPYKKDGRPTTRRFSDLDQALAFRREIVERVMAA